MIGVVLLNYNDWSNALSCIESLDETRKIRLYFINNGEVKNIEAQNLIRRKCKYIELDENLGYSNGNNFGIKQAIADGCDAILISNTDIIYEKNSISNLYDSMLINDADMIGPKIKTNEGLQEIILGCTVNKWKKVQLTLRKTPLRIFFKRFYDAFHLKEKTGKISSVYGMSGCCYMINQTAYDVFYPLDENVFLYNEEYILAEKMRLGGKKVIIDDSISITHIGGSSTKKIGLKSLKYFMESEQYVLRKYYDSGPLIRIYFLLLRKIQYINRRIHE